MFLRVIGAGIVGVAVASVVTTAAAGVVAAVVLRQCAKRRAAWPEDTAPPADDPA
ncbi:hypothetical protein [Roseomonas sp. CECT 9278]|uniref:hypothetical protein n=1 Tax=Roseomonas sp. CECT 9278 TaxID=2845823 RepID=UPI001E2B411A|nr:hypothetical protein [Roseomonas sp. CECT 9278]CAH0235649.1 hypothetical protein ROS9278_02763 [Roseomonas sp. CECT 9278]